MMEIPDGAPAGEVLGGLAASLPTPFGMVWSAACKTGMA